MATADCDQIIQKQRPKKADLKCDTGLLMFCRYGVCVKIKNKKQKL